jgi:hypothetical protein
VRLGYEHAYEKWQEHSSNLIAGFRSNQGYVIGNGLDIKTVGVESIKHGEEKNDYGRHSF